jgi:hypothetical protein
VTQITRHSRTLNNEFHKGCPESIDSYLCSKFLNYEIAHYVD